jgi:hypothetical protein
MGPSVSAGRREARGESTAVPFELPHPRPLVTLETALTGGSDMTTTPEHARDLSGQASGPQPVTDWTDLGREMWEYLTGRGAAVNYELRDLDVEVPRDTGPDAPRALWRFNGTVRVTTSDDDLPGADPARR